MAVWSKNCTLYAIICNNSSFCFFLCAAIREIYEVICSTKVTEAQIWLKEVGYLGMSKDMAYGRGYGRWLQNNGEQVSEGK